MLWLKRNLDLVAAVLVGVILTGLGGWSYRPDQTFAKRQQPTRRWEDRLKAGEIRLKAPDEKAGAATEETPAPLPPGSGT